MSAIGHGHREFDWDVWFGDLDGADYLTEVGKEAARRAIKDFTAFFGRGWLNRAIEPVRMERRSGSWKGSRLCSP